jgi:murein DD-endopeptidase MepM/ murein hydrolase activator NlpD
MPTTPRRSFRLSRTPRRSPRHALPAPERAKRNGAAASTRFVGFFAMAAAGLITVTCSVPATAVGLENVPPTATIAASEPHLTAAAVQVLETGTATQGAIARDGYTVTAAPPPPPPPPPPAAKAQAAAAPAYSGGAIRWPVPSSSRVSGDYGPRNAPCAGCSTFHKGADLTPGLGTPITSIASGVVTAVSATDSGGLGVHAVIEHVIDGRVVSSLYGHMIAGSLQLHVGQSVAVGQLVGNLGNTGQSTGAHLHFEILLDGTTPTDPLAWLVAHGAV